MAPTLTSGKICYLEIPTTDIRRSADSTRRFLAGKSDNVATGVLPSTTRQARSAALGSPGGHLPARACSSTSWWTTRLPRSRQSRLPGARLCNRSAWTHQRSRPGSATLVEMCGASISNPADPRRDPCRTAVRRQYLLGKSRNAFLGMTAGKGALTDDRDFGL